MVVPFIRIFRYIDGVSEELTGADDGEIRDHLDARVLKHLEEYTFWMTKPTKSLKNYRHLL